MDSRRAFLKKASMLAGATAAYQLLPSSIARALAIQVEEGSTYLDAEHVVFLMQENRSFDHCFGTLRGVRGFNDPRVIRREDGLPIWIQQNKEGQSYGPFHLDIENTKATWMGSLPHSWKDMVGARNGGKLDTWLEAKKAGNKAYQHMPLTMGYYQRKDIPFYYAFADAFTVCDQHFCSSLTGTSANRSYFWSGTIREQPHHPDATAHVDNGQINYKNVGWTTFPERLERAGISWRVYQNELSIPVGFEGEEEDWLANFTDNNLEFHRQYQVRFHPAHRTWMQQTLQRYQKELAKLSTEDDGYADLAHKVERLEQDLSTYSATNFDALDDFSKAIHQKAFTTNTGDLDYHRLTSLTYQDGDGEKTVQVPKGDIFHQFRRDVLEGNLPTVSWLAAPCRFSDHPSSPWFGAWYVSEALDILTENPEVWKKTIFILTYDENDGYFDHVAPFVPAHSDRPYSGQVPQGMDTRSEYVTEQQERLRTGDTETTLDSPIGLGFRVPMVVASPWTKGGWVNSEVLDLTSNIQFLEHFVAKKFGKDVRETNLTDWRRAVCGDMTSVFRPATSAEKPSIAFVDCNQEVERIYMAKDQELPGQFSAFSEAELSLCRSGKKLAKLPVQEKGVKPACSLPYQLAANLTVDMQQQELVLRLDYFGGLPTHKTSSAVPFVVRSQAPYEDAKNPTLVWNFTVRVGEPLEYRWPLQHWRDKRYQLDVHGPNGFFSSFAGQVDSLMAPIRVTPVLGQQVLEVVCGSDDLSLEVEGYLSKTIVQKSSNKGEYVVNCNGSEGWYDISIRRKGDSSFCWRYAGHLEQGTHSITDPLMGSVMS